MAVSAPALGQALGAVVGGVHLVRDPAALAAAAVDGVVPRWVARPGSVEEVSRLLALAAAERLAVAPRGGGSSVGLGNRPTRVDLVLDTRRLDAVIEYVPEDMVASVGAGMRLGGLAGRLERLGQRLPVDPPGWPGRTVGGVLATHDSGPCRFRYGTGRDLLLGVRFVQADGTITWGGSRVVKSVTGYDVPKLLVGSLGTLGVIVEATLRLHPIPPASGSWLFPFPAREGAGGFLAAVLDSTLQPERVVLLNEAALAALGLDRGPAAVAVSVGSVAEAVASQGESLTRLAREQGAADGRQLDEAVWAHLGAGPRDPVALRLAGEPARLVHWLGECERRGAALGAEVAAVGEAGSGLLRVGLGGRLPGAATWDRDLLAPLREALAAEGGSLVIERAPLALKATAEAWGPIAGAPLALMRRLKAEFDPQGILNPGRFVGGL